MKTEKISITLPSKKKKQLISYAKDNGYKSVSKLIEISTDFYINSPVHVKEVSTSLFSIAECIDDLEHTNLTVNQQETLNGIKERMDVINGCFKNFGFGL